MSNIINFTTLPKTSSGFPENCPICLDSLTSNENSSLNPVSVHISLPSSTQAIPKLSSSTQAIPKLTELILSRFPCHAFHEACLNRWFREHPANPSCPLCKRAVRVVREERPAEQAVATIAIPALVQQRNPHNARFHG